jgi:membrane associated rhomboid family serine protease
MKKILPFVFILILLGCFFIKIPLDVVGFKIGGNWYAYFTYSFFHENIFHLAVDAFSFYVLFHFLSKVGNTYAILLASVIIATGSAILSAKVLPTIGASGIDYALTGMMLCYLLNAGNKFVVPFLFFILLGLYGGFFIPVNPMLHLGCFFWGFVFWIIYKWND